MSASEMNKSLLEQAEKNVLAVFGSWDVPTFDYCVKAEYAILLAKAKKKQKAQSRNKQKKGCS